MEIDGSSLEELGRSKLIALLKKAMREFRDLRQESDDWERENKRSAAPFSKRMAKKNSKKPGRRKGKVRFTRRDAPEVQADDEVISY